MQLIQFQKYRYLLLINFYQPDHNKADINRSHLRLTEYATYGNNCNMRKISKNTCPDPRFESGKAHNLLSIIEIQTSYKY